MKEWSKDWKASKNPKKQRKYAYNLPFNLRGKLLSSRLSDELQKKHKAKNLRVRTGDKVKIVRGQHKGKTGSVEKVDTKYGRVFVSGIEFTKRDGSKAKQPIHHSKIIIQELAPDKRRFGTAQTRTQNTVGDKK